MTQQKPLRIPIACTISISMLINLCVWNLKIGAQELFTPPQSQLITRMPFTLLSGGVVILNPEL